MLVCYCITLVPLIRIKIIIIAYTGFRLVPKVVNLNVLERPNDDRYFCVISRNSAPSGTIYVKVVEVISKLSTT